MFALSSVIAATLQAVPSPPASLEIRFCPEARAHSYPLDSLRGVQGLLLQNVAIVNRSRSPVTLNDIAIQLRNGGEAIDERRFGSEQIAASAKAAQRAKAQGMFEIARFQFCEGRLFDVEAIASGTTLQPGEALLLMQNVFAYKGKRTDATVTALGHAGAAKVSATASIRLDTSTSKTQFRWPLSAKRPWLVGSGASFHTTHRWAVPEEFALDIIAIDAEGSTHRGVGAKNADFYAYGADVVAAAPGLVVSAVRGVPEPAPMLRQQGEAMEAYYGRIGEQQAKNLAAGERGVSGNAVVIDHGNGEFSAYVHLAPGSVRVTAGDRVSSGQVIGKLGSSGNSTEPHLHFQVCDKGSSLFCAGIPPTFVGIEVLNADGPRPIQSGDLVRPE